MRDVGNLRSTFRPFAITTLMMFAFASPAWAQPAGGKTSDTPKAPAKRSTGSPAKTPAKVPAKTPSSTRTGSNRGAIASIDGKWWTSGNDFGASEVVFTQNGSTVSGVIRYADGRTGAVNGTMIGKRLQHSWT